MESTMIDPNVLIERLRVISTSCSDLDAVRKICQLIHEVQQVADSFNAVTKAIQENERL